jgi:hypothetical protein
MSQEIIRLRVVGTLPRKWFPKYDKALTLDKYEKKDSVLFCDFSNFDIPLGFCFKAIRNMTGDELFRGDIELMSVSQAFAIAFDYIPKGHKTICRFRFKTGIPDIISSLPTVEDWYELNTFLNLESII